MHRSRRGGGQSPNWASGRRCLAISRDGGGVVPVDLVGWARVVPVDLGSQPAGSFMRRPSWRGARAGVPGAAVPPLAASRGAILREGEWLPGSGGGGVDLSSRARASGGAGGAGGPRPLPPALLSLISIILTIWSGFFSMGGGFRWLQVASSKVPYGASRRRGRGGDVVHVAVVLADAKVVAGRCSSAAPPWSIVM